MSKKLMVSVATLAVVLFVAFVIFVVTSSSKATRSEPEGKTEVKSSPVEKPVSPTPSSESEKPNAELVKKFEDVLSKLDKRSEELSKATQDMETLRRQFESVGKDRDEAINATKKVRDEIERFKREQAEPVEKVKKEITLRKQEYALQEVPTSPREVRLQKELDAREKIFRLLESDVVAIRQLCMTTLLIDNPGALSTRKLIRDQERFNALIRKEAMKFAVGQDAYERLRRNQMIAQEVLKDLMKP